MARAGADKHREDGPERRCIASGQVLPKAQLIRFVIGPDDAVVPDIQARLPGRGIWVAADAAQLRKAAEKRLFARAARRPVSVPDDLAARVETLLVDRVVSLIALARKAGQAVAGYERVKSWLASGEAAVLLQASDGSERGKSKLRPPEENNGYIGCLTASEIGLAFGRDSVIHGALSAGGLTTRVVEEANRLSGVRKSDGIMAAGKDKTNA